MNKRRIRKTVARLAFVLALGLGVNAQAESRLKSGEEAGFAIPRMSTPPTIDGTIDPVEWRESVAISGVVEFGQDLLIPRPTTFFMAWDAGHLYFACRAYVRPGYKPRIRDGRSDGTAYCYDDGLELVFRPTGKNVSAANCATDFRMFLNCLGNVGDLTRLVVGQQLKTWGPKFKTAVRQTAEGTAPNGGSWWELEVSTVPEDFELTSGHQAGDAWRFMFGFNHMPSFIQPRIPCVDGFFTADGKCLGTLVEDVPAVKMTMDSLNNLASDGTASLVVTAYNPSKAAAQVELAIDVAGTIVKHETLDLPAGGEQAFTLNEKLPADVRSGPFTVRATQDGKVLLAYKAFFEVGRYNHMLAKVQPMDPSQFSFETRYNPVRNLLLVKADSYYLPDPSQAQALRYRLVPMDAGSTNCATGKPVVEGTVTTVGEWYFQEVIKLPALTPGKYVVTAELLLKNGKSLGPITDTIEKKDEAKTWPEWWGKKYGSTERVLPPFEAIKRVQGSGFRAQGGTGFTCLGREYALNALGLPVAIRSAGEAVLAAPARLVVVVNGKEEVVELGQLRITEQKDWRVCFEGQAKGAGLNFTASGWLEQDGLVYVDLTYAPAGKTPVKVDALRLEFPLGEADADALLCIGPGSNCSSKSTILLPKDKLGRLWSTLDTGRTGSNMKIGSFYPTVWIGSERRGLLWWADNDKGWVQDNAVPAHEAKRVPGSGFGVQGSLVALVNHLVAKPIALDVARTVSFSYMATPFKPLYPGWRSTVGGGPFTFFEPFRAVRTNPRTGKKYWNHATQGNINWIHPESELPEEWSPLWAEQKQQADAQARPHQWADPYAARANGFTHMSFQLLGYGRKTMQTELYDYFGEEWESTFDIWNESYIDYAMYLFDRAFREGGVRSTYWDLTFPILNDSLLTELAYRLPDGRVQPGYNGWNIRRFFMRLSAVQFDNGLYPGGLAVHSTHAYVTVSLPWVDAILDGERDWNLDTSDNDWVDYYPLDRMRAMSVAHNWGTAIHWMSILHSTSIPKIVAAKTAKAEYLWMHDTWHNPSLVGGPGEAAQPGALKKMPTPVLDWGMNGRDVVYHPYWRNPYVVCPDKDVLVSLWRIGDDRVLVGVYNYDRRAVKDVTLTIDLEKLGLTQQLPWQEFIGMRDLYKHADDPDSGFDYYNRTLTLKALKPHSARFIGIRKY